MTSVALFCNIIIGMYNLNTEDCYCTKKHYYHDLYSISRFLGRHTSHSNMQRTHRKQQQQQQQQQKIQILQLDKKGLKIFRYIFF
jgi:hypothetical protein